MSTTIQVSDKTKQTLDGLKRRFQASYNRILYEMLCRFLNLPESLAGRYPELRSKKH